MDTGPPICPVVIPDRLSGDQVLLFTVSPVHGLT